MTNEELVAAIRDGNDALIGELWEQVKAFVAMMARKRLISVDSTVTEADDLTQCGYFALLDAIRTFDEAEGFKFVTWLSAHLKNHFNKALNRYTERQQRDPLHTADSLQRPIGDEGEAVMLGDLQPDESAQAAFEGVEHRLWNEQLRTALAEALDTIPEDQRKVIEGRYYAGVSRDTMAALHNVTPAEIRSRENKGMRALRRDTRTLRPFLEADTLFYRGVSVAQFNRTHTSSVESLAMWRENKLAQMDKP